MTEQFTQQYLGKFPPDPIYKAVKRAFLAMQEQHRDRNKGKNNLCPPSEAMLYHFIKCMEHGSHKPEDLLMDMLTALAQQSDDFYYKLIEKEMFTPKPIMISSDN